MEKLGVPTYNELIFVARREALDEAGASRLRRFLTATAAGHRLLREDPAAGVDALLEADKGLDRGLQEAVDQGDAAGLLPGRRREAVGLAGAGRLGQLRALDARERLLKRPPSEAPPLTNEFLPGRGAGSSPRADEVRAPRGRPTARRRAKNPRTSASSAIAFGLPVVGARRA